VTQKPTAKQQKSSWRAKKVEREAEKKKNNLQRWSRSKTRCLSLDGDLEQ
jgi:hypothetical protein